jgi:hypothetical protein
MFEYLRRHHKSQNKHIGQQCLQNTHHHHLLPSRTLRYLLLLLPLQRPGGWTEHRQPDEHPSLPHQLLLS